MKVVRKRGDTRPIDATLKRAGKPISLDGCAVSYFQDPVEPQRGTAVQAQGEVLDPVKSRVRWSPEPDDVSREGLHRAEFEVTFPDGTVETFPNGEGGDPYLYVEIIEDLGGAAGEHHIFGLADTGATISTG
jgi:hypothetical protein